MFPKAKPHEMADLLLSVRTEIEFIDATPEAHRAVILARQRREEAGKARQRDTAARGQTRAEARERLAAEGDKRAAEKAAARSEPKPRGRPMLTGAAIEALKAKADEMEASERKRAARNAYHREYMRRKRAGEKVQLKPARAVR